MCLWPDYTQRAQALEKVDAKLSANPEDIDTLFERARLLTDLGRLEDARNAYMAVIQRAPTHFGALNNLGGNLHATGFRTAARTAYAEAIARHPNNPLGHFNLGNLLREEGDPVGARLEYEAALRLGTGWGWTTRASISGWIERAGSCFLRLTPP